MFVRQEFKENFEDYVCLSLNMIASSLTLFCSKLLVGLNVIKKQLIQSDLPLKIIKLVFRMTVTWPHHYWDAN